MTRKMKDSGIEWIGEIPEKWLLERLKRILTERKEKNDPQKTDFILSLGASYGVIPYSEKDGGGNKSKENLTDYMLAYPNDIVMNSMNIISGSVGISKFFGCVSPAYYVLHTPENDNSVEFYNYLFQTIPFQRSLLGLGNGILMKESSNGKFNTVRMRIPMDKLGVLPLPVPPLSEQRRISRFLDSECAKIDRLIEQTRASIEEYKKLKQAMITEAVTKGVRGKRKMKDSGIPWIGEIPEEWEVKKLKYCSTFVQEKCYVDDESTPYLGLENVGSWNGQYLSTESEFDKSQSILFCTNDILFGKLRPYLAKVFHAKENGCCSSEFCVIRIHKEYDVRFFWNLLISSEFVRTVDQSTYGIKMPRANTDYIKNLMIPVPPSSEQRRIASFLDNRSVVIDSIMQKKERTIIDLLSYKKSLIYEYVTGKKEVPA